MKRKGNDSTAIMERNGKKMKWKREIEMIGGDVGAWSSMETTDSTAITEHNGKNRNTKKKKST